jgi:hypothetical protein
MTPDLQSALARIEELTSALKPFALLIGLPYQSNNEQVLILHSGSRQRTIPLGAFRKAREIIR